MFRNNPNIPKPTPKIPGLSPAQQAEEAILAKAKELNLGGPHQDSPEPRQTPAPRSDGYWQRFEQGWVYWTPKTGAHWVTGAIFAKWAEMGWEQGFLGFPLTDETPTPDNVGRYNHFEGGSIYWTPETGAHEVHGAIRDLWAKLGWEQSPLGYPTTDETPTSDSVGRYNKFQHGAINWDPKTGAQEVVTAPQEPPKAVTQEVAATQEEKAKAVAQEKVSLTPEQPEAVAQEEVPVAPEQPQTTTPETVKTPQSQPETVAQQDVTAPEEQPQTAQQVVPAANPSEPYVPGPSIRIDFEGTHTISVPAGAAASTPGTAEPVAPYVAAPPVRIDFEGTHTISAPAEPVAPYVAAPPVRIDFEGSHRIS